MLGAVPTMLLFLVTVAAYQFLVHTPLTKILQERYSKTQGAIENAAAAVAAAEQKTTEYEERLRAARAEILRDLHEQLEKVRLESEVASPRRVQLHRTKLLPPWRQLKTACRWREWNWTGWLASFPRKS